MKLSINRQELSQGLTAASGIVAARTPKPILQCVMLDAQPDQLILSTTDIEVGMRYLVAQIDVSRTGVALVNAETLLRIIREMSDEIVHLELNENQLHIRGEDSHFQIVASDPEEFPVVPPFDGAPDFEIEAQTLQQLVEWTIFACAKESTRYAINGILLESKDDFLSLVATDGRRLSRGMTPVESGSRTTRAIVSAKAMSIFLRLPAAPEEKTKIKVTKNLFFVQGQSATISSSLVEGNFPNYREVIPQDADKTAELDTAVLLSGLKRAALLTNEESRGVRMAFEKNRLTLTSRAPEQGEAQINIPVKYSGAPITIGFNPNFLIDALKAVRMESVILKLKDPQRPGVLQAQEEFIYVVMPVNL